MREFGYGWDEVHDEAEILEHAISDRLLERSTSGSGGRRMTRTAMRFRMPPATCTASPSCCSPPPRPGTHGRVLRVSDRDPELLRAVEAAGVDRRRSRDGDGRRDPAHRRPRGAPLPRRRARAVWLTA